MSTTFRHIAPKTFVLILLVAAWLILVSAPVQAQPTRQPKPTQNQSSNTKLAEQKNTRLQRVEFATDSQAISYFFKSGNKQRILTYRIGADSTVIAEVTPTPGGKPFIQLFASRSGVRARTPSGEYQLIKRKRVLPSTTDSLSVWLLANNFATKPTTAPVSLYEQAVQELARKKRAPVRALPALANRTGIFSDRALTALSEGWLSQGADDGSEGESDCLPGNSTCTEIDLSGNTKTIYCYCDCGTPVCYEVLLSAQVQVIQRNESTGEETIYTETVHFTKCVLGGCMPPLKP